MATKMILAALTAVVASVALSAAAFPDRALLQASAPAPGTANKVFDWGRPCTLVGNSSQVEITGPMNAACTACGSGATATPEPTCIFKALTLPLGYTISISYHSSVHHLFLGNTACAFTTQICPNATADTISPTTPCTYKFTTAGSFVISDKAGDNNADDGYYCSAFGAQLPVTISSSS